MKKMVFVMLVAAMAAGMQAQVSVNSVIKAAQTASKVSEVASKAGSVASALGVKKTAKALPRQ